MILHEKLSAQLPAWRERIKSLAKEHAEVKVDDVTVGQIVGGMRDIKSLLTDVSFVDPADGILFRGMSIPEVLKKLPKARGGKMPLVGGLYYLLMIGEVPTKEQARKWKPSGPSARPFQIMSTRCSSPCRRKLTR